MHDRATLAICPNGLANCIVKQTADTYAGDATADHSATRTATQVKSSASDLDSVNAQTA
jgi:hypothetical protein